MTSFGRRPTLLLLLFLASYAGASSEQRPQGDAIPPLQTYIVHMNAARKPEVHATRAHWYAAHLQSLSIDPEQHLLYSYSAFPGFAATLRADHLPLLRSSAAVLHVHPDPLLSLHTTRSPEFLGLLQPLKPGHSSSGNDSSSSPASSAAVPWSPLLKAAEAATKDVIVGVLDTGVWPESKSFSDVGLPEIPSRWRGTCEAGVDFSPSVCNRKLIGARSFSRGFRAASSASGGGEREGGDKPKEYASPRDRDGHGTHTASTAAGSPVTNASLFGYAPGTARGMAIAARIAAYKVCWATGCFGSDILAGMDAAISDGVDVLSLSLGGGAAPYFRDTIAIGAFAAAERGIFVSCSAGNSGPRMGSLANGAPWILTVGAGTLDRDFPAYATLGNGQRFTGVSLYSGPGMGTRMVPMVYAPPVPSGKGKAANGSASTPSSNLCLPGTLNPSHVRGKVVFCDRGTNARVEKGQVVKAAGGLGMILANTAANGEELVADSHLLPAVAVGRKTGDIIREYVRSNPAPRAVLAFGGTVLGVQPSPVVAAFSSRGPNGVTPEILKPDVIGPGVNILAAWSGAVGPTGLAKDQRPTEFNIMSGTSMSCPHVSGIAALLKAAHPKWSPSAIKSALMTTAYTVDNTGSPLRDATGGSRADPYAYGSGHVDPRRALSPGLVYDITTEDYIAFLCSLNYSLDEIGAVVKRANFSCSRRFRSPGELNYPSFSVIFYGKSKMVARYTRELTNVGAAGSVYDVKVRAPAGVTVTVEPTRLVFKEVGQKLKYTATFFSKKRRYQMGTSFGWITWINKKHQVRSPVAFRWNLVR